MNYLLDGRCEISNNRAERKAKSYAIGRKAFLFHTSEAGAGASAVMYSIVETAKANNLNIFQYHYLVNYERDIKFRFNIPLNLGYNAIDKIMNKWYYVGISKILRRMENGTN